MLKLELKYLKAIRAHKILVSFDDTIKEAKKIENEYKTIIHLKK